MHEISHSAATSAVPRQVVFRRPAPDELPAPGEIDIGLGSAQARSVIDHGLAVLAQGTSPIERIVVTNDPTLDKMLAVEFVGALLTARPLPAGASALAHYAALVSEGLSPGPVPCDKSIAGIYLAVRNAGGGDLDDPAVAARFLARWSQLYARLVEATNRGVDLFTQSLFEDAEFLREKTYLRADEQVYREDVDRGQRWLVNLPGGAAGSSALVLRRPRSLLFKHWARADRSAPVRGKYSLLVVHDASGAWIVSTDPLDRLPIAPLAAELQAAESQATAGAAGLIPADPWYDGRRHEGTLIASPRAGTKLADQQVLRIIGRWSHAKKVRSPVGPRRLNRRAMLAATAGLVAAVPAWRYLARPQQPPGPMLENIVVAPASRADPLPANALGKTYAAFFGTNDYEHWTDLNNPIRDARELAGVLTTRFDVEVLPASSGPVHENLRYQDFNRQLAALSKREYGEGDQLFIFLAGHGHFNGSTKEGFFIAADGEHPMRGNGTNWFPLSRLEDLVNKIECRHKFLMLDICYGGTLDIAVATKSVGRIGFEVFGFRRAAPLEITKDEYIRRQMGRTACRFMASCGRATASDGPIGGHSPFATALLAAFNRDDGLGADGIVTTLELQQELSRLANEPTFRGLAYDEGGEFLFVRRS